jgi:hypothetical protein
MPHDMPMWVPCTLPPSCEVIDEPAEWRDMRVQLRNALQGD